MGIFFRTIFMVICFASFQISNAQGLFDSLKKGIENVFDMSKKRLDTYKATTDKPLLDQFYFLSLDGKSEGINESLKKTDDRFELANVTSSTVTLKKPMLREGNMASVVQLMQRYSFDPLEDAVAKRYVSFANSRGSSVKLYRPALGAKINSTLGIYFSLIRDRNTAEWINVDNLLVEHSAEGKVLSFLTRSHQASVTIGVNSYQYVNIFFGRANGQFLENSISNAEMENNLIRTVGLTPASVQQISNQTSQSSLNNQGSSLPIIEESIKSGPVNSMQQKIKLLNDLNELRKNGVLTDAEFDAEKKKIILN
jgi:hypothetical protein